jgi:hypothetical protein
LDQTTDSQLTKITRERKSTSAEQYTHWPDTVGIGNEYYDTETVFDSPSVHVHFLKLFFLSFFLLFKLSRMRIAATKTPRLRLISVLALHLNLVSNQSIEPRLEEIKEDTEHG